MKEPVYEQLTLFPEGFLANPSPSPGSEKAREMTVTSGLKCLESYGNSSQLGCLVRMCLGSSIWHSTRCYLTWKTQATKLKHLLFRLAVSMPRTKENESLLWPTPSTGAALCGGTGNFKTLVALKEAGIITEEERRQLSQGNGGKTNPEFLQWLMGYEKKFTELIPTPVSSDYKGCTTKRAWTPCQPTRQTDRQTDRGYDSTLRSLIEATPYGRLGPMNPEYVEWLMGYPIGYTELKPSETQ